MKIKEFRISNYKCFDEGNIVALNSGMAVLTGRNSSGKTAVLEALSLAFRCNPHRSLARKSPDNSPSVVELVCEMPRADLGEFANRSHQQFRLPVPNPHAQYVTDILGKFPPHTRFLSSDQRQVIGEKVFSSELIDIRVTRTMRFDGGIADRTALTILENVRPSQRDDGSIEYMSFTYRNGSFQNHGTVWSDQTANGVDCFPGLANLIAEQIYRFSPERFCAGASPYGDSSILRADAGNLPEVLNSFQSHPVRFREYNRLVSRVLPQVKWVDTRPRNPNNEIWIWHQNHEQGRNDLAIPLTDCGTGVGHVLAIVYVLFTSKTSETILIDEPQSFLHPGAARRLMDVLSEFPRHQLLIATHSPTIISAGAVRQVLAINTDNVAKVKTLSWEDTTHRATLLNELGARLADVYGADNILWVEGPTEEECFPKILQRLAPGNLFGTAILAVRKTGDLEGKDSDRVFEIYSSLSSSGSLLPPTIAFLFDRECWSEAKLKELRMKSKGLLQTTERRTFENYLLHWEGIASVINAGDPSGKTQVTADRVKEAIEKASHDPKYSCDRQPSDAQNLPFLDAPTALKDLFNELSECRVPYSKTTHSVALCDWILENDPEFLRPVATVLKDVLSSKTADSQET